jgi:hypothetical protein
MRGLVKIWAILVISLLVSVSLIGCGTKEEVSKETVKNENISKVHDKKAESTDSADEGSEQSAEKEAEPATDTTTDDEPKAATDVPAASTVDGNTKSNSTPAVVQKPAAAPVTKPAPAPSAPVVSTPPSTAPSVPETKVPAAAVTISIKGPKDRGAILAPTKVEFKEGQTVYDILLQTTKKHGIQIETRGSGATAYVEGIDNIYEFDYGVKSGWVFELNGVSLTKSIGTMIVKDGDTIECYYTE